jgi:hypothetical protein
VSNPPSESESEVEKQENVGKPIDLKKNKKNEYELIEN